ncbi:hypothetical protein [Thermosinus carboxydivorans]|uniref:hypothetical protein n=1 Tax=Thermosinus carboxydivorans TaxID=261685 RepID=UPI0002DB42F6|nr:hypothetical protein [Thermosinus carboxydivorans]
MADKQKLETSKSKYGTLTATQDVNGEYTSSDTSKTNTASKQKASKSEYGTLTAKADANNDYE